VLIQYRITKYFLISSSATALIYLECSHDNLFVNFITDEELSEGFSFVTRDGRFLKTDSANATYEKGKNMIFLDVQ